MGTWGTGILQDDAALDVYGEYIGDWDEGEKTPEAIRTDIEESYADMLGDPDEEPIFWLALARAQWECGVLQPDVRAKAEDVISSGRNLERWENAFDSKDWGRRQRALARFWNTLQKPVARPRNRPRKRRYTRIPVTAGDCLAVRLADGDFGAALVLVDRRTEGNHLVGVLHYKSPEKPDLAVFERREWLRLTHHSHTGSHHVYWAMSNDFKASADLLEKVGRVSLNETDPQSSNAGSGWHLNVQIEAQFAWEAGHRD